MDIAQLKLEPNEFAWHDWQRSLKIRKPSGLGKVSGASAFSRALNAWHPEAFVGTPVEHMIAEANPNPAPRKVMFHAIDWCGNVIGQVDDCHLGPIGTVYEIQGLGMSEATYRLTDYGLELMPSGEWVWWLLFDFDKETYAYLNKKRFPKP